MKKTSYLETTPDKASRSTSSMVDALTTVDSTRFAFDLARGCLAMAVCDHALLTGVMGGRVVIGGVAGTTEGRDIVVAAKIEFRRANQWLDKVLGPLGYENVSLLSSSAPGSTVPRRDTDSRPREAV